MHTLDSVENYIHAFRLKDVLRNLYLVCGSHCSYVLHTYLDIIRHLLLQEIAQRGTFQTFRSSTPSARVGACGGISAGSKMRELFAHKNASSRLRTGHLGMGEGVRGGRRRKETGPKKARDGECRENSACSTMYYYYFPFCPKTIADTTVSKSMYYTIVCSRLKLPSGYDRLAEGKKC